MVNPNNVNAYLTNDLDVIPPAQQHRSYTGSNADAHNDDLVKTEDHIYSDKTLDGITVDKTDDINVDNMEGDREQAEKVVKTASWLSTFFLITTDVLGPSVAPWAFSILGFVPGSLIFFFLGVIATYTALILLNLFLKLDTPEQPVRTFSDLVERIFSHWGYKTGRVARHVSSFLQALQLFMAVAVLIFGSAAVLSQLVNFKLCFVICLVVFAVVGNLGGLVKTFGNLGLAANCSVWLNLTVCFLCLGVAQGTGAVDPSTGNIVPVSQISTGAFLGFPFALQATAISNIIYAYGGATMYVELMSEMKNPREFWKSLAGAEFIIIGMYFFFGVYFYSEEGQYTNPIPQATLNNLKANQAANVIGLVTGMIAAVMYGNVGLKVIYYTIINDVFDGPQLSTRKGTFTWYAMCTFYWWVAFVIAGSVPNIQSIVGVVGSLCIMQYSYTFPPLMQFLYYWQQGTTLREKLLDKWWLKSFDLMICLASLAATGIGMWGSIMGMIAAEQGGNLMGFGCGNPQYGGVYNG